MTVGGTHIRVMATGIGWRGALLVALPLKDVDNALHSQLLLLALIAAGGILLAAVLGLLVARTALAPIGRFTRETEAIADNPDRIESDRLERRGRRRAGAAGPDLQPHAGRARGVDPGPAQPGGRRLPRAAHPDRHDPRQPAADARRGAAHA